MPTFQEILANYYHDALKSIARMHGFDEKKKKAELVEILLENLTKPESVEKSLADLTDRGRQIVDRLLMYSGSVPRDRAWHELHQAKLVTDKPPKQERYGRKPLTAYPARGATDFVSILSWLGSKGLIFWIPSPRSYGNSMATLVPEGDLCIPDEIRQHIPPPQHVVQNVDPKLLQLEERTFEHFQREVYLYWDYVRQNPIDLTQRGLISIRILRKIGSLVPTPEDLKNVGSEPEATRYHLMRLLMVGCGLLRIDQGQLVSNGAMPDFFSSKRHERALRVFGAWQKVGNWDEFGLVRELGVTKERRSLQTAPVASARGVITEAIKSLAPGDWVSVQDLISYVRLTNYGFLFPREYERWNEGFANPYRSYSNPWGWHFHQTDEAEGWNKVEGGLIQAILEGPLHWMGFVSLGYKSGKLVAYRLTEHGLEVTGLQKPADEQAEQQTRIVVQPNFEITVLGHVGEATLARLDLFAERLQLDRAAQYRLSRESMHRALEAGIGVSDVVQFLEDVCNDPIPQNVRYSLEEWDRLQQQIVFHQHATLYQAANETLMQTLLDSPELQKRVLTQLSPTVALLKCSQDELDGLVENISHQTRCIPKHTTSAGEAKSRLKLSDDGVLVLAKPQNLYLFEELQQFADAQEGNLVLAESSVKRGLRLGLTAPDMLEILEKHVQAIPPCVVDRIRSWSEYYGKLRLSQPVLLTISDQERQTQLLEDPELRQYLRHIQIPDVILEVKPGKRKAFEQALRSKGISFK